jgi:hypothetical protein
MKVKVYTTENVLVAEMEVSEDKQSSFLASFPYSLGDNFPHPEGNYSIEFSETEFKIEQPKGFGRLDGFIS